MAWQVGCEYSCCIPSDKMCLKRLGILFLLYCQKYWKNSGPHWGFSNPAPLTSAGNKNKMKSQPESVYSPWLYLTQSSLEVNQVMCNEFFFTLLSMRSIWMIQWKPARIQGDELQKPLSRMIQLLYASALSTSWAFYWSCKGSGCCCCKGKFTSTTI